MLTNTTSSCGDTTFKTGKGFLQGGVLSPTLFNVYIDTLLLKLDELDATILAFADDLVNTTEGEIELFKGMELIRAWSRDYNIEINNDKSAILQVRYDKRARTPSYSHIKGIPLKTSYTYLGIIIDDCVTFKLQKDQIKKL